MNHFENIKPICSTVNGGAKNQRLWIILSAVLLQTSLPAAVILTEPPTPLIAFEPTDPPVELNLDGNGTVEFVIPDSSAQIDVLGQANNRVLVDAETFFSTDLSDGSFIGATPDSCMNWSSGGVMSGCLSGGGLVCIGNFLGGVEYLGVEFDIDGATHYGWVENGEQGVRGRAVGHAREVVDHRVWALIRADVAVSLLQDILAQVDDRSRCPGQTSA